MTPKEKLVEKVAKAAKMVNREGQKGDVVGVEVSDKESGINLRGTTNKFTSGTGFMGSM